MESGRARGLYMTEGTWYQLPSLLIQLILRGLLGGCSRGMVLRSTQARQTRQAGKRARGWRRKAILGPCATVSYDRQTQTRKHAPANAP